ncbi:protein kinase domain-containing protein [Aliikangiella sp. IMCC44653]
MKQKLLPFYQTGWFFLLLSGWLGFGLLMSTGQFHALEKLNREVLSAVMPSAAPVSDGSVELVTSSYDETALNQLEALLLEYPEMVVVLVGQPSYEWLSRLKLKLAMQPNLSLIVATENIASAKLQLATPSKPNYWQALLGQRFSAPQPVQWEGHSALVYAPNSGNSFGLTSLWRHQDGYFLSAFGQMVASLHANIDDQALAFDNQLEVELYTAKQQWSLGFLGKAFIAGEPVTLKPLGQLSNQNLAAKLLVVAQGSKVQSILDGQLLANMGLQVMQQKLHTQNSLAWAGQWIFLITALTVMWLLKKTKVWVQLTALIAVTIVGIGGQYIAFSQLQWVSVLPGLLLIYFSWALFVGYRFEFYKVNLLNQTHNKLLADIVADYYKNQQFEKLQPFLENAVIDQALVNKLFDVAIEAQANNHLAISKKLLRWIVHSPVKHPASVQKLAELESAVEQENLDATMVIEPGSSTPSQANMQAFMPTHFGRYQVEGVLGKGAMGIVYQGVDPKINRHVAIKTLQLNLDSSEADLASTKARFFREAETAGNLSHANIVTIYDVGEEAELGYIAMDLLTGAPLSEFIKPEFRLPAPLVYQLMIQMTDALEYAHRQQVVHRDIKPGNIIYDDEVHKATLTDFGIAYVSDNSKTRTGTIIGSPYYMSPEQVLGQKVDGRSDIFSLGVTFYQLLSGHLPFNGESIASVAYHITKTKQQSVRHWDSKLPTSAARITNKALQKDKSKRYQTAEEFKLALVNALKRDYKKSII